MKFLIKLILFLSIIVFTFYKELKLTIENDFIYFSTNYALFFLFIFIFILYNFLKVLLFLKNKIKINKNK